MSFALHDPSNDLDALPRVPSWITSAQAKTLEDAMFLSGAALSHLHLVLALDSVPHALLRERLALHAAEACVTFAGRSERLAELRDVIHLLRPGDLPGPAGEICLAWRRAVEVPVSFKALSRACNNVDALQIKSWLDVGRGGPVTRAAMVLELALGSVSRSEETALVLADATLSRALGWDHLVPLLAVGLKRGDLSKRGCDLSLVCHRAATTSAVEAARLAVKLVRRVAHLKVVAPKLRAKGAQGAVELFLTRDVVAPAALPLPDRAARRLCDRLVELEAIREFTGRDSFRLYGV